VGLFFYMLPPCIAWALWWTRTQTLVLNIGPLQQFLEVDSLRLSPCSACKCTLDLMRPTYLLFSLFASFTVDPWSDVWIATVAGVLSSLALIYTPKAKHLVVRLVVAGSYIGTIVWVMKKTFKILNGDVTSGW
jgi:hypothetical protein